MVASLLYTQPGYVQHSYWNHGPFIVSFPIKNGALPIENGDVP